MAEEAKRTATEAAAIVSTAGLSGLVIEYGIGGAIYALTLQVIGLIQGFGDAILSPFRAFGAGLSRFIEETLFAMIGIVSSGAAETSRSLTQGEWAVFGPATFTIAVLAALGGLAALIVVLRRLELRPWKLVRGRIRR